MDLEQKIIWNAARCLSCGDIVESRHRHDFQSCSCGSVNVDGGHAYIRRLFQYVGCYEELSITDPSVFDNLSEHLPAIDAWLMNLAAIGPTRIERVQEAMERDVIEEGFGHRLIEALKPFEDSLS